MTCEHVTGNCTKGCKPGWTGVRCQQPCKKGTYGQNCTRTCTTCLKEDCNQETGRCMKGCESGWLPPMCSKPCEPGTYGHNCVHTCGACADSQTCDHVIGTCKFGCSSGWRGEFCKAACPAGTYGLDCQMKCGHCINQTKCDNIDGTCEAGCSPGYEGSHCSKDGFFYVVQKERLEEDMVNTGSIVGGALGFVVIVGLIVLACVVRHWRGGNRKNKRESVTEVNEEALYENANINDAYESIEAVEESTLETSSSETTFYANTYYNMGKQSRGIPVVMLEDYINRLHDTPDGFRDQFEELRNCPTLPHVVDDHSRVVLKELPGDPYSDYINANYIDSVDMDKAYIASQGPNHTTISDFWRMVWQEQVEKIVMLANVVENGKVKCEQYWPDNQPLQYKDLLVTVVSIVDLAKYSIRQMTLKNTKIR
ncbi:hypothetical protein KUTeg_016265 [Tegillarca granosa]|uniref:protein-tyrosine-phosphatase n=1 Tax=Tegillarca granosa TaxID=220873 RepID=A0ABQ9EKK2_TEGGR|nr:hypothetical protein KUTeg_016265 [Tegillarca granosa]